MTDANSEDILRFIQIMLYGHTTNERLAAADSVCRIVHEVVSDIHASGSVVMH